MNMWSDESIQSQAFLLRISVGPLIPAKTNGDLTAFLCSLFKFFEQHLPLPNLLFQESSCLFPKFLVIGGVEPIGLSAQLGNP